MTDVTLPSGLLVRNMTIGQTSYGRTFRNDQSGAEQVQIMGPPLWRASIASDSTLKASQAALWKQLLLSLDGRINRIALYDLLNVEPRGTMRGAMQLSAFAQQGATSMSIVAAGQGAKTLLTSDWLTVVAGGEVQLVSLMSDATSDGAGRTEVNFKPALRRAYQAGSTIVWDKPYTMFRATDNNSQWSIEQVHAGSYSLSFLESLVP